MALAKEEIYSGGVRYYDNIETISEVADVHTAEEIASLTSLSIRDAKLKTSAGLQHLPNLKKLEITGPLDEISPASLEVLVAMKKGAGKVSIYRADDLYVRFPQLMIPPKNELRNGRLHYRSEALTIAVLADLYSSDELEDVTSLTLNFCELATLRGLSSFPNLESLDVQRNALLRDANPETPCESVQKLDLSNTGLATMAGLSAAFPNLRELKLSFTNVTEVVGLDGFEHLERVELNEAIETLDPGSLAKILAMRAEGLPAIIQSGDPQPLLTKYPDLVGTR